MTTENPPMTHDTRHIINTHHAAYEAYAEYCNAAMVSLMAKRSWKQLKNSDTKTEVCALANDYAMEMMEYAFKEFQTLEELVI